MWGIVAAAPDLIQYLNAPPWTFRALLILLAIGLPVVVAASWMFDLSVKGERPARAEEQVGPDGFVLLTPEDVHRVGVGTRHRILRWVIPIAMVVTLSFVVRWVLQAAPSRPLTVALQEEGAYSSLLSSPLEWLLEGRTIFLDVPDGSSGSLRTARRAGASYLVTTDTAGGDRGTLTMTLYDAGSEERLLVRYGGGPNEGLGEAAGRLALDLVRSLAELEERRLAVEGEVTLQTGSPIALFHFLEGQRRFGAADFDAAAASFDRAIQADSGFVPAYHRLAVVEQWRWAYAEGWEVVERALDRGVASPGWSRLLEAQRSYLERDADEALARYEEVTLHHPELREGWLGLGESLFHYGGFLGHVPQDARRPLERALDGDSLFAPVAHHLIELGLWRSDAAAARQALTWIASGHPVRPVMEAALAIEQGAEAERAAAWDRVAGWDLRLLSLLVAHLALGPDGRELADSAAGLLMRDGRLPEERLRGAQYRLMLVSSDPAWEEALDLWRQVRGPEPFDTWAVHAHQAGWDVPEAEAMLEWAQEQRRAGRIPDFDLPLNDDLRRALNALVHDAVLWGDSVRVLTLLHSLDEAPPAHPTDPGPEVLSAALRARLALLGGDTLQAVAELDVATSRTSEPFVSFYPASTMAPERMLLVRLNETLGRRHEAERWRSSFFNSLSLGDLPYQLRLDDVAGSSPTTPQGGNHE